MKLRVLACVGAALLSGCASQSVLAKPPVTLDGVSSDLRVFLNDQCLPEQYESKSFGGATFLTELVVQAGSVALKSFGALLQEMGSPKLDRSTAVRSDVFFSGGASTLQFESVSGAANVRQANASPIKATMNRNIRCIHVVRDGFFKVSGKGSAGAADFSNAPPEFQKTWRSLGLQNTPSFYALVRLDPSADGTAFRGELLRLAVDRFERPGAHADRDYMLHLEFEQPNNGRYNYVDEKGELVVSKGGPFAHGSLQLARVKRGLFATEADLVGKETGWMPPPSGAQNQVSLSQVGLFNLQVDLIELKRGDPLLADLGAMLQSTEVQNAAKSDIKAALDQDSARQTKVQNEFTARAEELKLIRTLEDSVTLLEDGLAQKNIGKAELLSRIRNNEDASLGVQGRRAAFGWQGESPQALLSRSQVAAAKARARLEGVAAAADVQ